MGLFDSGPRSFVTFFDHAYTAAGRYRYGDSLHPALHGTISVPLAAAPASGTTADTFTLTRSTGPAPEGYVFDTQIERPRAASFQNWQTSATSAATTFAADAGPGVYSFRSRLRKLSDGTHSDYSPPLTLRVTP
jgi:hypothetical protein